MKKVLLVLCCVVLIIGCVTNIQEPTNEVRPMEFTSTNFEHEGKIPLIHTCYGEEVSPGFTINGVPSQAKSLTLIMDDPDAQPVAGKIWDHWIVFNIPPSTTIISEGTEPQGIHGKGTGGNLEYRGPCPPNVPEHAYIFKLYALDVMLDLTEGATKQEVLAAMEAHVIKEATLIGRFQKP
jgi:Raf kinase inhibitor-like YbhB/YbcL family protein